MKDILNKLLESKILTEETVSELETAINEAVEQAKQEAREEAVLEATAEVTRQWEVERTALIESIDTQITDSVGAAVTELAEAKEQLETLS